MESSAVVAVSFLSGVCKALMKNGRTPTEAVVFAEIDRRVTALAEGWEKVDSGWRKRFASTEEVMDFMRVLRGIRLRIVSDPLTEDTKAIIIKDQAHQMLMMVLEGRFMEIEKRGKGI